MLSIIQNMWERPNDSSHISRLEEHSMGRPRFIRYRRPSLSTMLGVTRAKKRLNRQLGITAVKRPFRAPGNMKRRFLRHTGYYSGPMKFFRFMGRMFKK